jgi:hypothetical protein
MCWRIRGLTIRPMRTEGLMPPLRPRSHVPGLLPSELRMSSFSLLMQSLPSGSDAPFRGNADGPASLDSEFGVLPRLPREPMPASIGGLSLRFPCLRASALPLALGLIQSRPLILLQSNGLASAGLGSWPRGGHGAGGLAGPCRILRRCCGPRLRPAVRVGLHLG